MNIESKMFVRYGIPGWYFALCIFISLKVLGIDFLEITGLTSELLSSVILVILGVPVGYILYQFYFFTTHKNHKYSTPDWNVFVYSYIEEEDRKYVSGRYAHMLRGIHELGVLRITILFSLIVSYIPTVWYLNNNGNNFKLIIFLLIYTIINGALLKIVSQNYKFKQDELQRYIEGIKNSTSEKNKKHQL